MFLCDLIKSIFVCATCKFIFFPRLIRSTVEENDFSLHTNVRGINNIHEKNNTIKNPYIKPIYIPSPPVTTPGVEGYPVKKS